MLTLYEAPYSTNVQRVEMALAHKGLTAERVSVDFHGDRALIKQVSGQSAVPVLDHDGEIVTDSTRIINHLERHFPDTPSLWPAGDPSTNAQIEMFVDWFNRTWKREPNLIDAEWQKPEAEQDADGIARWSRRMQQRRDWFEALLSDERPYLFGATYTIADVIAWPFMRFAAGLDAGDDLVFHRVCFEAQPLDASTPNLAAWIERVGGHPR